MQRCIRPLVGGGRCSAATTSQAAPTQADETEDQSADTEDELSDGERPQNHGWFVSQAAHDKSTTGSDHGKAVSAVARGDDGNLTRATTSS